jgi:hypothetical protein
MFISFGLFALLCLKVSSFTFNGITQPLGYFDPLGFAKNKPMNELVKLREAELKHARWGMISAVAIPITELVTHQQAIHVLDDADMLTLFSFTGFVGAFELQSILLGWENPFTNSSNYFVMKSDYQPGDLGFNIKKTFLGKDETFMVNAELNNGRLAMIGSVGMIVQELVSNQPIF